MFQHSRWDVSSWEVHALLAEVLTPFAAALLLAYLLEPIARIAQRWGLPRALASLMAIAIGLLLCVGLVAVVVPVVQNELSQLQQRLPGLVANLYAQVYPWLADHPLLAQLGISLDDTDTLRAQLVEWLGGQSAQISRTAVSTLQTGLGLVVSLIGWLVLVPVVLFFLLKDWARLLGETLWLVPRRHRGLVREVARDIHVTLLGYLQGQLRVVLAMAVFYSLALLIAGLSSWLSIGIISGLAVFIPYVGFVLSTLLALVAAMLELGALQGLLAVSVIYILGQLLEGFVLTPKLVGDRIGLHPLGVIFALMLFGSWFGFLGVLLALPVAAVLVVLGRRAIRHVHQRDARMEPPDQAPRG